MIFARLKDELDRNPALLIDVLGRLRQSRAVQQPLLQPLADAGCAALAERYAGRLITLQAQAETLIRRLTELGAKPHQASMPLVEFLSTRIKDGASLSELQRYVFMETGQAEVVELLEGLVGALKRDIRTRQLFAGMLEEERDWQRWLAGQIAPWEGTAELRSARAYFKDLYGQARVYAIGSFLSGGLFNFGR